MRLEADQEDLKCQLSIGSQERSVRVITSLFTLALIWKCFNLDLGLLRREPSCGYPVRRSRESEVKQLQWG